MAYNVANCAHNKVCTTCPSRVDCDMRKLFYNEEEYLRLRTRASARGFSAARIRGFSEAECNALAKETAAVMDHRRIEELRIHPQYSET